MLTDPLSSTHDVIERDCGCPDTRHYLHRFSLSEFYATEGLVIRWAIQNNARLLVPNRPDRALISRASSHGGIVDKADTPDWVHMAILN